LDLRFLAESGDVSFPTEEARSQASLQKFSSVADKYSHTIRAGSRVITKPWRSKIWNATIRLWKD